MSAFISHFMFEFKTGVRDKQLLLMNYLFPIGFFLMMGFILVEVNPFFLERMVPGMVIFAIMAATFLGIPSPLVDAREKGIFRSYKINGIPSFSILMIPVITTALHLTIVGAIITVTGPLLFGAPSPIGWAAFVVVFLAAAWCMAAISILIGVLAPNSRVTVLYSQIFFVPSILLAGFMLPYSMLPETVGRVAQILPATQAMNAFVGLAMKGDAFIEPWSSVAILVATGIAAFMLAMVLFVWDRSNTKRRGHPVMALLIFVPAVAGIFFAQ